MGDQSTIEWTDATWNPVTGCSKVSPGCAHCYAESLTRRFAATWGVPDLPWTPANAAENVILHRERLDQPLKWRRPRMVFVNSMSDLFHEQVPDSYIESVFGVMAASAAFGRRHTFQVLTKRPERMRDWIKSVDMRKLAGSAAFRAEDGDRVWDWVYEHWPLPNVWLGVSIENRRYVDRADLLRETPAAVRFISAEPLLGPLLMTTCDRCGGSGLLDRGTFNDSCGTLNGGCGGSGRRWADRKSVRDWPELDLTLIDWLIVGGESGAGYRPMHAKWATDLRNYCQHSRHLYEPNTDQRGPGTAFFFKQWGGRTPKANGRELDGRTWDEMPRVAS